MKVGLEIQPLIKNKTGVGWYTRNIIENLHDDELEFEGYGFDFLGRNNMQGSLSDLNIKLKLNKIIPYSLYRRFGNYLPLSYNNLVNTEAEVFHFFNYIIPPKVKGKILITVYDLVYKLFPETMSGKNYRWLEKGLENSAARADKIITISQNSKEEIIKYLGVAEEKIEIVYPGVNHKLYSHQLKPEDELEIRKKYSLPERFILYLGTLEPRKNIGKIIEAYAGYRKKNNSELSLVLAGQKGWRYTYIFNKIKDYNLGNRVHFTGYVAEEDKPAIYQMSEMFIFPSLYEGFGLPVLEAMAAGIPVITSCVSALPEVAGKGAITVAPGSVTDITGAIKKIAGDKIFRNELAKRGLEQSKKFSWEESARRLTEIYREMFAG